ncbi:MAG TPA: protein translocase subunit SecD [Dehalococcoidales bacterium]
MRRNTIVFLIILVIFLFAAAIVFPIGTQAGGYLFNRPIVLGLDLNGGVRLVYQADLSGIATADQKTALDSDVAVIGNRVNSLGATNPVINELSGNRILVELPGISDVNKATQLIGQTAILEFGELVTGNTTPTKWTDSMGNWNPAMGTLNGQQVELTSAYFQDNTYVTTNSNGQLVLIFNWNSDGSTLSGQITQRLLNKPLGIFSGDQPLTGADGHIIAPTVQAQITTSGEITGLSQADATQMSKLLNAGRLQVPLTLMSNDQVSSTLGGQFVDITFKAALIGLALVMIFMMIYYRLPGVLSALALCFYALLNLAIFKLVPITMTLGGLAGFIASIGMAVDANVLIFERMKEETRAGRTIGAAIEAGFKRAWSAILDCNVTTFLACIVMYFLGSATVASSSLVTGFALTLFIGVAISMFTAITVTLTLLRLFIGTRIAQKTELFLTIGGK